MTIKSLFNIILKVWGLFFIKDIVTSMLQISWLSQADANNSLHINIPMLLTVFLVPLIYILVFYLLVFKTNTIIGILKLDKGFDEETIALNTHRSTILGIAIIVIGGYMVVSEVPNVCGQLITYYQTKDVLFGNGMNKSYLILDGSKIAIGLLLMGLKRPIVNLIERGRKN